MRLQRKNPMKKKTDYLTSPVPSPLAKKLGRRRAQEPVGTEDSIAELRRLVHVHRTLLRDATAVDNMSSDRVWKKKDADGNETKETVPCRLPEHNRVDMQATAQSLRDEARSFEKAMLVQLKKSPIYIEFLSKVKGVGVVTSAYLVAMVRIDRAVKVSALIRYCGFGTCTVVGSKQFGKSERRDGAPKYAPDGTLTDGTGTFNDELKASLVVCFKMMRQSCAKTREEHRYLKRWDDAKRTALTMPNERLGRVMRPGEADDKGRRKATDLFLWDLYVMWRTIEGLPVWPDKYSSMRGFMHGGAGCENVPKLLSLDEAMELSGLRKEERTASAAE